MKHRQPKRHEWWKMPANRKIKRFNPFSFMPSQAEEGDLIFTFTFTLETENKKDEEKIKGAISHYWASAFDVSTQEFGCNTYQHVFTPRIKT